MDDETCPACNGVGGSWDYEGWNECRECEVDVTLGPFAHSPWMPPAGK